MSCALRRARGFTLIELMMVVAIIGILATVAYPVMQKMVVRAKATERTYMMRALKQAIEDVYRLRDRFPPDPAQSVVASPWNPPLPLTTARRIFQPGLGAWTLVTPYLQIEGSTYYSYQFTGIEGGLGMLLLATQGDLDGDGRASMKWIWYRRDRGVYLSPPGWEFPAAGQEDELGPYRTY